MTYNAIGNTDDLTSEQQEKWLKTQTDWFNHGVKRAKKKVTGEGDQVWIFDPIISGTDDTSAVDIKWNAFPKKQLDTQASKNAAYIAAQFRDNQEEYCEWEVERDPETNLPIRAVFTTEAYDYYNFLFSVNPNKVLELYQKHISEKVKMSDLIGGDNNYNPFNKWNNPYGHSRKRGTIMHMLAPFNAILAAIVLAAEATWPVLDDDGNLITEEQALIGCLRFGDAQRHSDPHIGAMVNSLTRSGNEISLAGPIGLYIHDIQLSSFETPDGSDPKDWMKVERGDQGHRMRIAFEPPNGSQHTLGDLKIDGRQFVFGGQIAEKMEIRIRALKRDINLVPDQVNCKGVVVNPPQVDEDGLVESTRHPNV